jgi:hypothetical protein
VRRQGDKESIVNGALMVGGNFQCRCEQWSAGFDMDRALEQSLQKTGGLLEA